MNIPNIARMGKMRKNNRLYVKHRDTVPKLRAKLERLEEVEEGLRVELASMQIELEHARLYDNRLKGYMDKLVFVAKQFRWIALALIVIVVAIVTSNIFFSVAGQR